MKIAEKIIENVSKELDLADDISAEVNSQLDRLHKLMKMVKNNKKLKEMDLLQEEILSDINDAKKKLMGAIEAFDDIFAGITDADEE